MSALGVAPHPYLNPFYLGESVVGTYARKLTLPLPATATQTLFTVTGGAILVSSLVGVVTTAIQNQACNLSLGINPTTGSANTAGIGGPTAITNLAVGSHITVPFAVGVTGLTLVAPSVPASGTATTNLVTNNYHGTVAVTLSGFTLTAVFVNGVNVGSTNATYQVPAHGTISITYTVAGTWTWVSTSALVTDTFGAEFIPKEFVVPAGTITWTTSATNTGAISWFMNYMTLDGQSGDILSVGFVS